MILKNGNNLLTDLEAYWKLNGNAVDSVGARNGTEIGGVNYVAGKIYQAAELTTGKRITFPTLSLPTNWTFNCWFMPLTADAEVYKAIVATQAIGFGFYYLQYAGTNLAIMYDGSIYRYNSTPLITNGWNMITFTYANGTGRWYLNGDLDSSVYTGVLNGYLDLIGGVHHSFNSNETIDEIGIWNRVLTTEDIYDLYNNGAGLDLQFFRTASHQIVSSINNDIDQGLNSYYKLNGNSNDSVGSNNGTDTNITYVSGKADQCASFNGTSSQIVLNNSLTANGTISFWINPSTVATTSRPIYKNGFYFYIFPGGDLAFDINGGGAGGTGITLIPNVWQLVTLTYSGTGLYFYYNGVLAGQRSGISLAPAPGSLVFGSYGGGDYFSGMLDDVRIYNKVLDSGEVRTLYGIYRNNTIELPKFILNHGNNLLANIIHYWPLAGDSIDYVGGINGTDTNITYITGKVTQAASFNGLSSKIDLLSNVTLSAGGGHSFSYWIIPRNDGPGPGNALGGVLTGVTDGLYNHSNLGLFQQNCPGLGGNAAAVCTTFGQWTHIVLNWQNDGVLQYYVNGVKDNSYVGQRGSLAMVLNVFGYVANYNGWLDTSLCEFGIWDRVLTKDDIQNLYNRGKGLDLQFFKLQ